MSLAAGRGRGEQCVCADHGWRFGVDGEVNCPLMPVAGLRQPASPVRDVDGLIWLRRPLPGETSVGAPPLPSWPSGDLLLAGIAPHTVPAPLVLKLANFSETEHITCMHQVFGFTDSSQVELRLELEPACTRM